MTGVQDQRGTVPTNVESLKKYVCPDWFRDAKFGIWSHWGRNRSRCSATGMRGICTNRAVHSTFITGGNTAPVQIRLQGYHQALESGKFRPGGLMDLYVEAGAKYFVAQAMHHDNFDNFDSAHNPGTP